MANTYVFSKKFRRALQMGIMYNTWNRKIKNMILFFYDAVIGVFWSDMFGDDLEIQTRCEGLIWYPYMW